MLRRRADPHYRRLWLGDWRHVLATNGAAAGDQVELIVLTAPGADDLPWDRDRCVHGDYVACSGPLGCRVDDDIAREWNRTAPARWTALHRAAATRARRKCGSFKYAFRAWEPQQRGVWHMNVVVPRGTPRQKLSAGVYRDALVKLAPRYDFGFVDRKRKVTTGLHAARYLAKYLSEGHPGKLGMGDMAARGDCPAVIARVSNELTRKTGCTMRSRRVERGLWLLARDLGCTVDEARAVRVETGKHSKARWSSRSTSGRSSLPFDTQHDRADLERAHRDSVDAWISTTSYAPRSGRWTPAVARKASQVHASMSAPVWPIPRRDYVEGVDY